MADSELGEIVGEINFPPIEEYPNREEFGKLYEAQSENGGSVGDFKISKITFSQFEDVTSHQLTGI